MKTLALALLLSATSVASAASSPVAATHPVDGTKAEVAKAPRSFLGRWFGLSSEVKQLKLDVQTALNRGDLIVAANAATREVKPSGLLDRLALNGVKLFGKTLISGARQKAIDASLDELHKSAKEGNTIGVGIAREAIGVLREKGDLGWLQRWRVSRAENKSGHQIVDAALTAAKNGAFSQARLNLDYATKLWGEGDRTVRKANRLVAQAAEKFATKSASLGDDKVIAEAISTWQDAAKLGNGKFDQVRAGKILAQAKNAAIPKMLARAQAALLGGKIADAGSILSDISTLEQKGGLTISDEVRALKTRLEMQQQHVQNP